MNIVVTGYTYTRQNLFEVFESYPERKNIFFILPNNWTAKDGQVKFEPFTKSGFSIFHSPAFFTHSHYPIIGGLLKGWMPFFVFRLLWLRMTQGVDILFTAGEPNLLSTLYNACWAKMLGMKHVFHFWENIPYEAKDRGLKGYVRKAIIRAVLALSDGALCGMKKAERILGSFRDDFFRRTFLHAGFNTERFKPSDSGLHIVERYHLHDKHVFLFVGALGYRKGIHLALQALAELRKTHPVHLLIVGSGEYGKALEDEVQKLAIYDDVTMIPWVANEDLPAFYNAADVFIYPSIPFEGWEEQFGYSIAEASLCELPIISTATGSIDEVVKDGITGVIIPPNDLGALVYAMSAMIADPERARELGRQGRVFIQESFSNAVIAQKMLSFFNDVGAKA
ncbi:MAG: glycosyltransferase family 4 protein [Patescibacteria group bacterium]